MSKHKVTSKIGKQNATQKFHELKQAQDTMLKMIELKEKIKSKNFESINGDSPVVTSARSGAASGIVINHNNNHFVNKTPNSMYSRGTPNLGSRGNVCN